MFRMTSKKPTDGEVLEAVFVATKRRKRMYSFRVVTTTLMVMMMVVIGWFALNTKVKEKATLIGFGVMEIIYIMALVCMWG